VPLFDTSHVALERALSGASLRQQTLAGNLANANTPGYRRQDVDFHGALQAAMTGGSRAVERVGFSAQTDAAAGVLRPDGGTVDPDREAALMAENGLTSDAIASVLRSRSQILRTAIGG
jgi:flagellar basal-body rod protein FlgB